jgi:hypothetical protein
MTPHLLDLIGLTCTALSGALLFLFSPTGINLTKDGHQFVPFNDQDEAARLARAARYRRHTSMSRIGFALLVIGSFVQALAIAVR